MVRTASASSGPPRIRQAWRDAASRKSFWPLVPAVLLFNVGVAIFLFLYNLFMLHLGYAERSLGLLAGMLAFGSMAGTIPIGLLAQRLGTRKVLVGSLLAVAAGFAARLFLLWYPAQLVFAFFDGVMLCGWAVCLAPAVAAVVDEHRRPAVFSILFAVAVAAGSLGGLIGGNMPGWWRGLALRHGSPDLSGMDTERLTLLVACGLTALAAWPITRIKGTRQLPVSASWSCIWQMPPFLVRYLIAIACWAAAIGAFNPFTNLFFVRYVGVAAAHLGNFFALAQLVQAGAVLLTPLFLRRAGNLAGIVATQMAAAIAAALLAAGRGVLVQESLYCAFMAAQHMCDPALQSLLMDSTAEAHRSSAASLSYLTVSIAQALSAAISGIALQRYGYPAVLAAVALGIVAAALGFRRLSHAAAAPLPLHRSVPAKPSSEPQPASST